MFEKNVLTYLVLFCLILAFIPLNTAAPGTDTTLQSVDQSSSFFSTPEHDQNISNMMEKVNSSKINEYITKLQNFGTRYIGTDGNENATKWINQKFDSFGLKSELQNFTYEGEELSNVIATQQGVNPDKEGSTIVIGAHFDSISGATYNNDSAKAPGADDDASGVAATLETARILSRYNYSRTIKYCAWNAEEVGLVGSNYFVSSALNQEETKIDAMFQYDMVGYSESRESNVKVHSNHESRPQLDHMLKVNQIYENQLNITPVYNSSMRASDHSSFWSRGYNATMMIEENMNPYYHSTNDTIDKMSMKMMEKVTQLSVGCSAHLGELVKPDPFLFYLQNPEPDSLHHGGESMEINWFLDHENLSSSEFSLELNYTTNSVDHHIGSYQGEYRTEWELPEINGNLTLNCRIFHPDDSLIFEDHYELTVDSVAPEVSKIEPSKDQDRIDNQRDKFTAKFSEEIDEESISEKNVYFQPDLESYYLKLVENDTLKIRLVTTLSSLEKNTSYSLIFRNITDRAGNTLGEAHVFNFITTKNELPIANFTFNPKNPEVDQQIKFESGSKDSDGEIVRHRWDFGGKNGSDKENPTMTFENEGIFYVNLTVWDEEGASSSVNKTVNIIDPIDGDISIKPEKPLLSDRVKFSLKCKEDVKVKNSTWHFGDGSTCYGKEVVHEYSDIGTYNVTVNITAENGITRAYEKSVEIQEGEIKDDPQTNDRAFYLILPGAGIIIILLVLFSEDEK